MSGLFKFIITVGLVVFFVNGLFFEPDKLIVHKFTLNLEKLDKKHDNLKVAVISDLHAGAPFINKQKIERVVFLTNAEKPDLILLPGDFVTKGVLGGEIMLPKDIGAILSKLDAKYGKYAVLGNHDFRFNPKEVQEGLEQAKIKVLRNSSTKIDFKGKPLWIAGIDDLTQAYPDINKALKNIPTNSDILLMSHEPDTFPFVPQEVSLTVAGHTHGGQINLPYVGRLIVPSLFKQRYAYGVIKENHKDMFVSSGIGTSILPIRYKVTPEIEILTLKAKK